MQVTLLLPLSLCKAVSGQFQWERDFIYGNRSNWNALLAWNLALQVRYNKNTVIQIPQTPYCFIATTSQTCVCGVSPSPQASIFFFELHAIFLCKILKKKKIMDLSYETPRVSLVFITRFLTPDTTYEKIVHSLLFCPLTRFEQPCVEGRKPHSNWWHLLW